MSREAAGAQLESPLGSGVSTPSCSEAEGPLSDHPESGSLEDGIKGPTRLNHAQTSQGNLKEVYLKTEQKSFGISKPNNHQSLES